MKISQYQQEQLEAVSLAKSHLEKLSADEQEDLRTLCSQYIFFRNEVEAFQNEFFSSTCTASCFQRRLSACCSREGIITFFADAVINELFSPQDKTSSMIEILQRTDENPKCVYLNHDKGCMWEIKPIVCAMFLCEPAKIKVFSENKDAESTWNSLKKAEKDFTWPDKKVLFDILEEIFISAGYNASTMYLHNSPGLLRIKKLAGARER